MRRLTTVVLLAALAAGGCKRRHHPNPSATIEEEGELSPSISMSEPADSTQLLNGFHGLEQNSWRWTMKEFAVSLGPPKQGAIKGAWLELHCALPEVVAGLMRGVKVGAQVGATQLEPVRIEKTGEQVLRFDVPPSALRADAYIVKFDLDKAVAPSSGDSRQLGLVVSAIGFVTK